MAVSDISAERAKRVSNNRDWLPSDALREVLREITEDERRPDSVLILCLNEDDDGFETSWVAANLKSSQMIALMEMVKATILRDMGLT